MMYGETLNSLAEIEQKMLHKERREMSGKWEVVVAMKLPEGDWLLAGEEA